MTTVFERYGGAIISAGAIIATGGLGGVLAGGAFAVSGSTLLTAGLALASGVTSTDAANRARKRAQAQYNASLQDRYQMIKSATAVRQIIYGQARTSGPILFAHSSGDKEQYLHLVIALAGHECDGIVSVLLNDTPLPAENASTGFVESGSYFPQVSTAPGSVTRSGAGAVTVPANATITGVTYGINPSGGTYSQVSSTTQYTRTNATTVTVTQPMDAASPVVVRYTTPVTKSLVRVRKWAGATAGTVQPFPELVTESGGKWTTGAHLLRGIAAVYLRLEYSQEAFGSTGLPNISAVVRGRKVRDPRTGLTVWSDNSVLCLADYLRTYRDATAAQLPDAEVSAAANVCDQLVTVRTVTLPGVSSTSTDEARYTTNGVLSTDETPRAHLDKLVEAMAGQCVWTQGRWLVRAGAHRTAALTITESMLGDAPIAVQPFAPRASLINRVVARYADAQQGYTEVEAPAVTNALYVADDGGVDLPQEMQLELVQGAYRAQRLAKIELERRRQALTVSLSCSLRAYDLSPGDTVALSLARYGWSGKLFTVLSRRLDLQSMQVSLTLQETAAGVWDWNLGNATSVDLTPNTSLPDPFGTPSPLAGLTASSATVTDPTTGARAARIALAWTLPADVYVAESGVIEIEFRDISGAGDWVSVPAVAGGTTTATVSGVVQSRVYEIRARAKTALGKLGQWVYVTHTVPLQSTVQAVWQNGAGQVAIWVNVSGAQVSWIAGDSSAYLAGLRSSVDTAVAAAEAADAYAEAQAALALTTAQAYADGIVSAEEARAIADATAKAEAARVAAVATAAADATAKANAAQAAAAALASAAQADADAANASIANIVSDAVLTPVEKPRVVQDRDNIIREQASITAQATALGITTERTAYTTAVTALTNYLATLTGWDVIPGSNVAIVGATFRTRFADVYAARQSLLSKIASVLGQSGVNTVAQWVNSAGQRANWVNTAGAVVTWIAGDSSAARLAWERVIGDGRPADGATVGATFGVDINGQARTEDILPAAATDVLSVENGPTSTVVSAAGTVYEVIAVLNYTNNLSRNVTVQFEAVVNGYRGDTSGGQSGNTSSYCAWHWTSGSGAAQGGILISRAAGVINQLDENSSYNGAVSVASGKTLSVKIEVAVTYIGGVSNVQTQRSSLRLSAIKL